MSDAVEGKPNGSTMSIQPFFFERVTDYGNCLGPCAVRAPELRQAVQNIMVRV